MKPAKEIFGSNVEVRETHISWVFLTSERAYKLKKPVDLGFLDFSSLEKRRAACEAELELNRRLAPDVYLGLVAIRQDKEGHEHLDGDGEIIEWAVCMKRLPDAWRADIRLSQGRLTDAHLRDIALVLADFHQKASAGALIDQMGIPEAIAVNIRENFSQTRSFVHDFISPEQAQEIEAWQLGVLAKKAASFHQRIQQGRIRDGHGDLRLEHIYIDEQNQIRILDCIEFSQRFRFADVCADIAFLAMDLAGQQNVDLAERFLAFYAQATNDYDLYELVDFYQSYRAYVRAKISSLLALHPQHDMQAKAYAHQQARNFYLLSLALERPPLMPQMLIAVGGWIASGKSTIANLLGQQLSAPVIDSDRTRKYMLGHSTKTHLFDRSWTGAYSQTMTESVYREVLRRAKVVLASGRSAIVDASFRSATMRRAAQSLAQECQIPFRFIECQAPPELCQQRLLARTQQADQVSDGRLEIFADFINRWEPVEEAELGEGDYISVDTSKPLAETLDTLRKEIPFAANKL